jgi:hypothetical protein
MLTANADSHLQRYEKKKIGREIKTDKITGTTTTGDTVIGDLLDRNMILIPVAIDPFGQFGPILQTFLYDTQPTNPITFTPTKPNATSMYHQITHFPSPKGILKLTDHNWKLTQTRRFYGHSYSAPTPTINTLQEIGLTITKAKNSLFIFATRDKDFLCTFFVVDDHTIDYYGTYLLPYNNIVGDCHYWNKIYFRDLCQNKPRINLEYLRIE